MVRRFILLPLLILPLVACITTKPRSANPTPSAEVLGTVPVRAWGDNTCGSGALSAVLNHYGDPVTEAELDAKFPKGRHGGVVSLDLLLETRRRGFEAELVRGDEALLIEKIQNGTPAILMLRIVNLPGARGDLYHYVIADGWDRDSGLMRFQFGDGRTRWVAPRKLDGAWEGAGRATLLVEPLSLEEALRRAVVLETRGNLDEARESYLHLIDRYPQTPVVWTNLGNVQVALGERDAAESSYRKAIELAPDDRDALNNLAWLMFESDRLEEAEPIARRAVELGGPDPHLALDTLGQILAARGNCDEAARAFSRALGSPTIDARSRAAAEAARMKAERRCASVASSAV